MHKLLTTGKAIIGTFVHLSFYHKEITFYIEEITQFVAQRKTF